MAKRFRVIILRECRVRDLREMGVGWVRDGYGMGATCRRWWCCAGAGRAMTERRWRARRDAGMLGGFSVVISATGAGERSVFPENVTQRVLRPQTALFHPFFYIFPLSLTPVVSKRGLPPTRPRHARCATPLREDLPRRDHTLACMSNAK